MNSKIDIFAGGSYPSGELSNFNKRPFRLFGCDVMSMEGFLQGLRYKDPRKQKEIFSMHGIDAKRAGKKEKIINNIVYFQGRMIHRMSEQYYRLVKLAYFTMARNNPDFCKALIATGNRELDHSVGKSEPTETILTVQEFCGILYEIRGRLLRGVVNVNT